MKENRVKILLTNSRDEVLLCKVDGVYHFVGGHPENDESIQEGAKREVKEETGIEEDSRKFMPFLSLKQYKRDYFGTGKNGLATITFIECYTDKEYSYEDRKLDEREREKDFKLEYVKIDDIMNVLEQNKEVSRLQKKEFITTEMMYVMSEYKKQRADIESKDLEENEMEI